MNKFIKLLIESIDDDDFFSDLGYDTGKEVTFLIDDKLYPENVKILEANPSLQDIENIDHIGTILSKDGNIWLLWNLNNEYWDPFDEDNSVPSEDFGEIVGVCVGNGMFAKVGWSGLTNKYSWANVKEPIYNTIHEINIKGSGYDSTMNIINNYSRYIQDTIWVHLVNESTNEYQLYLPNKEELKTICNNVGNFIKHKNTNIYNLLNLTDDYYWSSSLYADYGSSYYLAYFVYFTYGGYFSVSKTYTYCSVALLYF